MRFYLEYLSSIGRPSKMAARRRRQNGFTLPEILLASVLMLIAVAIAGNGVVHLLRNNYKANADSELRNNVNRTLEFITNEVRRAKLIADHPSRIVSTRVPADGQAILAFQIPDPNNPSQPIAEQIVYYVQNRANPWLGPRVLWRYGPRFDDYGNYETPTETGSWETTPIMDLVMDETDNNSRRDCDPYRPGTLSGWQKFPADDSQVQGIYSCVKEGGSQVILAANTQLNMTTNEAAAYALSTKVATRATDAPFYLASAGGSAGAPDPFLNDDPFTPSSDPPFTTDPDVPSVPVLTGPGTVGGTIIQSPPGSCTTSGSCYVSTINPSNPDDRFTASLTSGANITVEGQAGFSIGVFVEGRSNIYGNNRTQTVNLYTYGQPIPASIPNVTLTPNQVLVSITNQRVSPPQTYVVLVNIASNN